MTDSLTLCDRCKKELTDQDRNFTELYHPEHRKIYTIYLCNECQTELCRTVLSDWMKRI